MYALATPRGRLMRPLIAILMLSLAGCATTGNGTPIVRDQVSDVAYRDAYRTISRQFEACYRVRGIYGQGFDVHADLDTERQMGRVELFAIGLSGTKESNASRVVTVVGDGPRSRILTSGVSPRYVERTHEAIGRWLTGDTRC